jgi:hypothetical protein
MLQGLKRILIPSVVAVLTFAPILFGQVVLTTDGHTEPYARIKSVLGAPAETPDCSHPGFGPHITQTMDDTLGRYVFVFNIHVTPDNDRCKGFDRQRLEIKTEGSSPAYVKGSLNDSVNFRWLFRLPEGFQPSSGFTHIHQIKAFDGDAGAPLITLTPRKGSPNKIEIIHIDSNGHSTHMAETNLAPFLGEWVEAYERITYNTHGTYSIVIRRVRDGAQLFAYSNNNIDLWRKKTTVMRPKWGIYRSLKDAGDLRDEQVRFGGFCLAKGKDDCAAEQRTAAKKSKEHDVSDKTP